MRGRTRRVGARPTDRPGSDGCARRARKSRLPPPALCAWRRAPRRSWKPPGSGGPPRAPPASGPLAERGGRRARAASAAGRRPAACGLGDPRGPVQPRRSRASPPSPLPPERRSGLRMSRSGCCGSACSRSPAALPSAREMWPRHPPFAEPREGPAASVEQRLGASCSSLHITAQRGSAQSSCEQVK